MSKSVRKLKSKEISSGELAHSVSQEEQSSFISWRFQLVFVLLLACCFGLFYKSFSLQFTNSEKLIKEANNRSLRVSELPYTRGKILDREGKTLSISVPSYEITIDPKVYFEELLTRDRSRIRKLAEEMGASASKIQSKINHFIESGQKYDSRSILNTKSEDYWTLLAQSTGLNYSDLIERVRNNPHSAFLAEEREVAQFETQKIQALAESVGQKYNTLMAMLHKSAHKRFLSIAPQQPEEVASYAKALKISGIVLKEEFRRMYPLAEEAAQLIGFTDSENNKLKGASGLERSFDSFLVGKNGKQTIRKDAKNNVIERISDEKQYDPQDVMLSIDADLQSMAYREIKKSVVENKAESGTAVLVDIQTGEILAMANAPSYNPNNRAEYKDELARNLAITDTFEPGSTVKPLVVLTALHNKVTYPTEIINTRPFIVNGHTITDVAPRESLTLTGILQKSSNIGVSRLALRMPSNALVDTYSKVGFGKDTELGLGENKGSNGDRKRWSDIERASLAYGYGLTVTPVQLARAYVTLGSFGIYRPLSITKVDPPVIGERVLPEKITRDVVHMMESVAQKGEGGQKAAVKDYRVAVKTGTVRTVSEKGGYNSDRHISYTAGIAPASDPRFSLVVIINEPKAGNYYGGSVAAPIFSNIMGYTLKSKNIKPDNLTE